MSNAPNNLAVDSNFLNNRLPGQSWSADDQCRMIYGPEARFTRV